MLTSFQRVLRASLLLALAEPASTSQLAHALGTVGNHLAVLREVARLDPARDRRSVLYRRTAIGDVLAAHMSSA